MAKVNEPKKQDENAAEKTVDKKAGFPDSTAASVSSLVRDHNALLQHLRDKGVI